ncbi:MAG: DUF58 domain-containing protein [Lachnospiraceae bacterium]|nr:DUF58 domain-containing protein [Lachnospiraceae bacterium]
MKNKNLPYQITYVLEILLVLLGAIFYRQPLLSVLLLLLVLLPPISIILTKYEITKLSVRATALNKETIRDGIINIKISANYKGLIPLLNCTMNFTFQNLYYPHTQPQEFVFPAETRRTGEFTLPFSVTKAGMIEFKTTGIDITDYLHLYTFTRPLTITIEIPVIPKDIETPSYPKQRVSPSSDNGEPSEIYTAGGEKTRDIKQLREYRSGDRLKDVHWKLTAKTDELMVREYEEIKELYYLIIPILKKPDDTMQDTLQNTLETFLSVGKDLLREREPYSVAIYNSSDNTFTMDIVTEEEDLYSALYEMYKCPIDGYENALSSYKEQYPENSLGMIIIEDGRIGEKETS